jgi:hypothetical protein
MYNSPIFYRIANPIFDIPISPVPEKNNSPVAFRQPNMRDYMYTVQCPLYSTVCKDERHHLKHGRQDQISRDASNSNSNDSSNSRDERNSRNATTPGTHNNNSNNTVVTPAIEGMLAKVMKPALTCREANYSRDTFKPEMTAAAGTIETSWMSTAAGPPESDRRKVSNNSEASNIQQGCQQQQ